MNFFTFFTILCSVFILTKPSSANHNSSVLNCNINISPELSQIQGQKQSDLPEFNLFCTQNKTMINFPYYGDLIVESISYDTKRLQLSDPKNCVHEVFLNLNLTFTPFRYYYVLREYRYINCSEKIVSFVHVPCLSGSSYYVYIVEPSFAVPSSCDSVKTVEIPFSYSAYLSDSSFGLGLTWDSTLRNDDEAKSNSGCKGWIICETIHSKKCLKALYAVSCILAVVLVVGYLLYATISRYNYRKVEREKLKNMFDEADMDKFEGEYEALNPAKDIKNANVLPV